jgi:hypothetical protein
VKRQNWFSILMILSLAMFTTAFAGLELVSGLDFDSDTLGVHPDASLTEGFYPSNPYGVASYSIVDDLDMMTNQSLQAVRTSGPGSFNFGLNLPAEVYSSSSFRMKWRFAPVAGGPYVFVVLRGPNLAIHGSLTLTSSSVLFSSAWGSQNDIHVGSHTTGESVDFDWVVDRVTGVQTLSLNGVVVVDAMATGYHSPLVDANRLAFEGAGQGAMTLAIDNLEIYAGTGTTPNETKSWGEVKNLYR